MEEFSWYLAFVGRPNAGKSSLISKLTSVNPTIGKKPGSTRRINEYEITTKFRVVDVPGWGKIHSRTSDYEDRIKDQIIEFFEQNYRNIPVCILVIDTKSIIDVSERLSNKGIIPIDQELYQFLFNLNLKPIIVFNKIDKVTSKEVAEAINYFKKLIDFAALPNDCKELLISVSAKQDANLDALRDLIRKRLKISGLEKFERYIKLK
ncbi:MAG: GTP-binding protein EngB [Asgard group archaeon]|nr:GTP-binding protein EngB [Asgard group archaeon]